MDHHRNIGIIWKKFLSGNKEAFAFLYNNYIDSLYRYGTKISKDDAMVKDAVQEIFLDLYLKREKNNTNPENLKFYLFLALKRNLIRKLKKNRKLLKYGSTNELVFDPVYSVEKKYIEEETDKEVSNKIFKALENLPAKQKEALYLRFNESIEYDEIAEILDISVESVRKQVYRGLKKVRESFKEKNILFFFILSRKK